MCAFVAVARKLAASLYRMWTDTQLTRTRQDALAKLSEALRPTLIASIAANKCSAVFERVNVYGFNAAMDIIADDLHQDERAAAAFRLRPRAAAGQELKPLSLKVGDRQRRSGPCLPSAQRHGTRQSGSEKRQCQGLWNRHVDSLGRGRVAIATFGQRDTTILMGLWDRGGRYRDGLRFDGGTAGLFFSRIFRSAWRYPWRRSPA